MRKQIIYILGLVMLFLAMAKNLSKPGKEGLALLSVSWVHPFMVLAGWSVRYWSVQQPAEKGKYWCSAHSLFFIWSWTSAD